MKSVTKLTKHFFFLLNLLELIPLKVEERRRRIITWIKQHTLPQVGGGGGEVGTAVDR